MIGQKISPILVELENTIWEFEANIGAKPDYTDAAFRAIIKIFMSAIMDKTWELQLKEKITMEDRIKMVEKAGTDMHQFIKTYTDYDTFTMYDDI